MKTLAEKIAVMQYFENGGEVTSCYNPYGTKTINNNPIWDWVKYDYDIKEEPQYVPFTFEDDLLGLKLVYINSKKRCIITKQVPSGVYFTNNVSLSYEQLLKYYKFYSDGTPCGKLETI